MPEVVGMLSGIKDDTKEEIKVETATEEIGGRGWVACYTYDIDVS